LGISSPQSHSPAQILAGIEACTQHLADLKKIVPQLCGVRPGPRR
jgi:hypothetical protein